MYAGCSKGSGAPADPLALAMHAPVPVLVARVVQKTVPIQLQAIGTVEAYSTVSVKSQIDGKLAAVYFKEGDYVVRGQLLFTIDPQPFQAALAQAEANLARDQAQAAQARGDEQRYKYLVDSGVGTREQADQAHATAEADRAIVMADRAEVDTAKINLGYTQIRSPIDGRTGNLILHPGNLVKANDSSGVLVVINQLTPIYVDFNLPESALEQVRMHTSGHQLAVEATPKGGGSAQRGTLDFIDNNVNANTGTFELKGVFANQDRALWPGQFVDATLTLSELPDTLVVPAQAVQTGQDGSFVFVVAHDMSATPRPVIVGDTLNGETVIEHGLKRDETVVTDGQLRLFPGAHVRIKTGLDSMPQAAS